ncbi:MAG: hypothetical protein PHP22_04170 [Oscillospiraceae bacterium]|jgi:hypothetical protein|nr:hypothetical protein [Oscillospiraceae bacterium]
MSYTYKIGIKIAKANTELDFLNSETNRLIRDAENEYNDICGFSAQNPKTMIIEEIFHDSIVLTLNSTLPLRAAGKALRPFSQILLRNPSFTSVVNTSGQLFQTFRVSPHEAEISASILVSVDEIDDLILLKSLMDYIYRKRDSDSTTYRKKRAAINRMKQIAIDSGIIVLGE